MSTFAIGFSNSKNPRQAGIDAAIMALNSCDGSYSLAVCFASIYLDLSEVLKGLCNILDSARIVGGSSYREICPAGVLRDSVVVLLLPGDVKAELAHASLDQGVSTAGRTLGHQLKSKGSISSRSLPLALMFSSIGRGEDRTDPIEGFQSAYQAVPFYGGLTCGDYDLGMGHKDFWTNYQFIDGSVREFHSSLSLLQFPKEDYQLAFAYTHGWHPIGEVQTITRAEGSVVYEIDGIPVIDFYRQFLGDETNLEFFETMIQRYSLGLQSSDNMHSKSMIKLPVKCDFVKGCIHYLPAENLQGKTVRLLVANRQAVLSGAKDAAKRCRESLFGATPDLVFIVSCCSRSTILHSRLQAEVMAIREEFGAQVPVFGFYSGGELVPHHGPMSEVLKHCHIHCGSAYHASTICLMAIKSNKQSLVTGSSLGLSLPTPEPDLQKLLYQAERVLDDTEQILTRISQRHWNNAETIRSQHEDLKKLESLIATYTAREVQKEAYASASIGLNQLPEQSVERAFVFMDIQGFTRFSEEHLPQEVIKTINQVFAPATEVLLSHGGDVDKFIGDCIFAVFESAQSALNACKEILLAHRQLLQTGLPFGLRCGINFGRAVRGNVGNPRRRDYTYIGASVNLAQRLESQCPLNHILITKSVYDQVDLKSYSIEEMRFRFKGIESEIQTYSLNPLQ